MKKIFIALFVLIPVAFLLVSGCVQQEQPLSGNLGNRNDSAAETAAPEGRNESVVIKGNDEIAIRFNTSKSTVIRWKSKTRQELTSMAYAYAK